MVFYKYLISKAELAHKWQHAKQASHAKYYSEDDTLTFSAIAQINHQAQYTLQGYINACIHLHDRFLDSPLTVSQSKQQAMHLMNNYSGEPGNQTQFKQYFSTCLREILVSPENHLPEAEYSSDDFVDGDGTTRIRKIPRLSSFEIGFTSTLQRGDTLGRHNNDFGYFIDTESLFDEPNAVISTSPVIQTAIMHSQEKDDSSHSNHKRKSVSFFSLDSGSEGVLKQTKGLSINP